MGVLATSGEEFGWTGYLLPKLLPLGRGQAAVLYGGSWGLWHAPILWGGYSRPGYPWIGMMWTLLVAGLAPRSGGVLGLVGITVLMRVGTLVLATAPEGYGSR